MSPQLGVYAYDCKTGAERVKLELPPHLTGIGSVFSSGLTPDRRFLLVQDFGSRRAERLTLWQKILSWLPWQIPDLDAMKDLVIVFDMDNLSERFRLEGWNSDKAMISTDGKILATSHHVGDEHQIIRCWEIDARKPLHWAIGVPAGLAAIAVVFAWWRGRRKKVAGSAI